jgi:hypothetical protein
MSIANIFDGFDDWMEAREPGYKARRAFERERKERERRDRAAALVAAHGSVEAVLAPCAREAALIAAVAAWRKPCAPPHERWTQSLAGVSPFDPLPPRVDAALRAAIPLPATIAEARAEFDYWRRRAHEIADVRPELAEYPLDAVAERRMRIVERLIERDLPVETPADLLERFRLHIEREFQDHEMELRLFHDRERLVAAGAMSGGPRPETARQAEPSP